MIMKKLSKFLLIVMLFIAMPVNAATIDHFHSEAADDIVLNDNVNGSTALAGNSIETSGKVDGFSALLGNNISFDGQTDYGLFLGNNIEITGNVNNDALIAGNIISTDKNSKFNRDTIIAGADVVLAGDFSRNVSIYGTKIVIKNANIKGNVKLYSENIKIENSVIAGNLSYPSDASAKIGEGIVAGKIIKTDAINNNEQNSYMNVVSSKVLSFACYALIFAIICLLFPKVIEYINKKYEKISFDNGLELFTKGLLSLVLIPIIAIILMITVIGVPLSIILIVLYFIALYLSTIFMAYLLGYKIWQKLFNKDMNMLLIGLIGLFILLILNLIPGIRYLVAIITIIVGLGLIIDKIKEAR